MKLILSENRNSWFILQVFIVFLISFQAQSLIAQDPIDSPSQAQASNPWRTIVPNSATYRLQSQLQQNNKLQTPNAAYFALDKAQLNTLLKNVPEENLTLNTIPKKVALSLPLPNGKFELFYITETQVLPKNLSKKYPQIRTFKGISSTGDITWISLTQQGISALIYTQLGSIFLDAETSENNSIYKVYFKKDYQNSTVSLNEILLEHNEFEAITSQRTTATARSNSTTRTFKIAISTTGEYTQFHGGKVEDGLAAVVSALTRVNAVYERELGIRFILTEKNDQIIFTDPNNDPFTNNNARA
ncbi:MAG: reprolysin-like metallopeptidase, partial [Bacteroidota bacterium]